MGKNGCENCIHKYQLDGADVCGAYLRLIKDGGKYNQDKEGHNNVASDVVEDNELNNDCIKKKV